jgi:hypothetical protein
MRRLVAGKICIGHTDRDRSELPVCGWVSYGSIIFRMNEMLVLKYTISSEVANGLLKKGSVECSTSISFYELHNRSLN